MLESTKPAPERGMPVEWDFNHDKNHAKFVRGLAKKYGEDDLEILEVQEGRQYEHSQEFTVTLGRKGKVIAKLINWDNLKPKQN